MADADTVLTNIPADPPIPVTLRASTRARRITLRVSSLDGRVTLTLPRGACRHAALDFARSRIDWIRAQQIRVPDTATVREGTVLPVFGVPRRVVVAHETDGDVQGVIAVRRRGGTGRQVASILRAEARRHLSEAVGSHARTLGKRAGPIVLRDTRSRWGSCSGDGRLMFSWRLILAPPAILDYVAAHEVAHLVRMDHSPAFWAQVARLVPDHETPRRWLREHGPTLHAWRFDD